MTQRSTFTSRWAPLVVLMVVGAMVFHFWQSLDLMLGLLNQISFCG